MPSSKQTRSSATAASRQAWSAAQQSWPWWGPTGSGLPTAVSGHCRQGGPLLGPSVHPLQGLALSTALLVFACPCVLRCTPKWQYGMPLRIPACLGWRCVDRPCAQETHACPCLLSAVGDSRAVLSRGGRAVQVTDDHKPEREDEAVSARVRVCAVPCRATAPMHSRRLS